jgi:hypothetical protein
VESRYVYKLMPVKNDLCYVTSQQGEDRFVYTLLQASNSDLYGPLKLKLGVNMLVYENNRDFVNKLTTKLSNEFEIKKNIINQLRLREKPDFKTYKSKSIIILFANLIYTLPGLLLIYIAFFLLPSEVQAGIWGSVLLIVGGGAAISLGLISSSKAIQFYVPNSEKVEATYNDLAFYGKLIAVKIKSVKKHIRGFSLICIINDPSRPLQFHYLIIYDKRDKLLKQKISVGADLIALQSKEDVIVLL